MITQPNIPVEPPMRGKNYSGLSTRWIAWNNNQKEMATLKIKEKIKSLLHKSEDSHDKIVMRQDGTGIEVGYAKYEGASKRSYTKASKLAKRNGIDIIHIHSEVMKERS